MNADEKTVQDRGQGERRNGGVPGVMGPGVMMTNYVRETDEEMRQRSNRTFQRILASLKPEVAQRYGHVDSGEGSLRQEMQAAVRAENWELVEKLAAKLAQSSRPPVAGP
jgi:hypothetical protein